MTNILGGLWPFSSSTPTSSKPAIMSLNCLIKDQLPAEENLFTVDVGVNMNISQFKSAIVKKKKNYFKNISIDPDDLQLWQIDISQHDNEAIENLILDDTQKLSQGRFINKLWSKQPSLENIHVIINVPVATQVATQDVQMTDALPYTPRREGLGGTHYNGKEGNPVFHEGLDFDDRNFHVCYRDTTVQGLADKILQERFLLVRAPPMSGKTSLGQLLERHFRNPSLGIRVIRISLLWLSTPDGNWEFADRFEFYMGITWTQFVDECRHISTVLIVDEVQMLYKLASETSTHHGGDAFWAVIKKTVQGGNLHIIAFATYGYRGAWDPSGPSHMMDISPVNMPAQNYWGLEELRFTDEEHKDFVSKFCEEYFETMKEEDIVKLQEYLLSMMDRHPGLVSFSLQNLRTHFSSQVRRPRNGETVTFGQVYEYMKSYEFWNVVRSVRAYPKIEHLTDDEKQLCDDVFRYSAIMRDDKKQSRLIKTNLLVEKNGSLEFSAPYLCALYMQERWGCTGGARTPPKNIKELLVNTFSAMDPTRLQNSRSVGKDGRLLERAWQMEFYRAATQVLPSTMFISPDAGANFGSNGFVDFWVDDGHSWMIELLRDGDKAQNHEDRFRSKGTYEEMVQKSKEWAIVDVRNPDLFSKPPAKKTKKDSHWINVYCGEKWEYVIMEYKDEREKIILTGGKNPGDIVKGKM